MLCCQDDHENLLRPALGHPHKIPELQALCDREAARHEDYVQAVQEKTTALQVTLHSTQQLSPF